MQRPVGAASQEIAFIDPSRIPSRTLATSARMPAIGLETFGSDDVASNEVAEAVRYVAGIGSRHFDCASVYGNESRIGAVFRQLLNSGLRREELWITSKLWNDKHGEQDVIPSCEKSLADLQLAYLDLYLVHWTFPNHHPPGCDAIRMQCSISTKTKFAPVGTSPSLGRPGEMDPGSGCIPDQGASRITSCEQLRDGGQNRAGLREDGFPGD